MGVGELTDTKDAFAAPLPSPRRWLAVHSVPVTPTHVCVAAPLHLQGRPHYRLRKQKAYKPHVHPLDGSYLLCIFEKRKKIAFLLISAMSLGKCRHQEGHRQVIDLEQSL